MLKPQDLAPQLAQLERAPRWVIAFSGGLDSTVLLHILQRYCHERAGAPPLSAVHVNHNLHRDAARWQAHCEAACDKWHIACKSQAVHVDSTGGMEAAARAARYAVFDALLEPDAVLLMAHHLDDQVETYFLRLMRGAGIEGLAAMPARRSLGAGELCRPLLNTPRSELEAYAQHWQLDYIDDPSNSDTAIDRNFLRAEVLPKLAQRWPAYRRTVARASAHMSQALAAVADALGPLPTRCNSMGDPGIPVSALLEHTDARALQHLRIQLRLWGCRPPPQAGLEEFLRQLRASPSPGNARLQWSDHCLQRYRDGVYLLPPNSPKQRLDRYTIAPNTPLHIDGVGELCLHPTSGPGLHLAAQPALEIGWRENGQRCRPIGRGGSVSLKQMLQERGIPPWWRDKVPLLYRGDELLAVGEGLYCESDAWRGATGQKDTRWEFRWRRFPAKFQ